tara:strand:- start:816 stop:1433 length:618 start_codon:yes stop_codon:yes gene_type:complete
MKKSLSWLLIICILGLANSVFASIFMIGANGGQTIVSDDFEGALSFGGRVSFAAREGFVLEGSANYFDAESKTIGTPSLKAATGLATFCYMIPIRSSVRPYVGISGGLSFLSSAYDSPALTYGAKAGFMMSVSKDTKVFLEASKLIIESSVTNVDIQPLTIGFGLGIAFGANQARLGNLKPKKKRFENRRRPGNRGKRPRPRGRR